MPDLVSIVDGFYKLVTGVATLGILWGVWRIAWWVKEVDSHMATTDVHLAKQDSDIKTQNSLLHDSAQKISLILGRLLGPDFAKVFNGSKKKEGDSD